MDLFFESLDSIFAAVVRSSGRACVLIGLVLAVQTLLRDRLAPRWRHALWLLVLIQLCLPWAPQSRFSLYNLAPFGREASRVTSSHHASVSPDARFVSEPEGSFAWPASEEPRLAAPASHSAADKAIVPPPPGAAEPSAAPLTFGQSLALVWLLGVITLAAFAWRQSHALASALRGHPPISDPETLRLLERCKIAMGVRAKLTIVETSRAPGPSLFGVLRPRLLLPEGARQALGPRSMRHVFLHELAHLKRHDIAQNWLAAALLILHWFNPLLWLAMYRMREDRELACDALALSRARPGESREYGATIVALLERYARPRITPSLAGILEEKSQLKRRIAMIARFKNDKRRSSYLGLTLLAVLASLTLTGASQEETSPPPASETQDASGEGLTEEPAAAPEPSIPAYMQIRQAVDKEIADHYTKAHPEVQEYIRWTAETFGRGGLWLPEDAFTDLTPEERKQKAEYYARALEGEYGRHLCNALAAAGPLKDERLVPGVLKAATYHREDRDYDCRPKWMAVAALGRLGDESAVPALIDLVDHGNQNTRMWARASLARLLGQNFNDDKKGWARWWNDAGKTPRIDVEALKPWKPIGASASKGESSTEATQADTTARLELKLDSDKVKVVSVALGQTATEIYYLCKPAKVYADDDPWGIYHAAGGGGYLLLFSHDDTKDRLDPRRGGLQAVVHYETEDNSSGVFILPEEMRGKPFGDFVTLRLALGPEEKKVVHVGLEMSSSDIRRLFEPAQGYAAGEGGLLYRSSHGGKFLLIFSPQDNSDSGEETQDRLSEIVHRPGGEEEDYFLLPRKKRGQPVPDKYVTLLESSEQSASWELSRPYR